MIEVTDRKKKEKKRRGRYCNKLLYTIPEDAMEISNLLDSIEFYTNILLSPAQTGNCDMK